MTGSKLNNYLFEIAVRYCVWYYAQLKSPISKREARKIIHRDLGRLMNENKGKAG
jgi:hypothetical protein